MQLVLPWIQLGRSVQLIVFSALLWSIGGELYDPFLAVYLGDLGASPATIGLIFSGAYLVSTAASLPGGILADRVDRKHVAISCLALGVPSTLILALAPSWQLAVPGLALLYLASLATPAFNAYVADAVEQGTRSNAFALYWVTTPLGALVGPGLGGLLASQFGIRALLMISFVLYLLGVLVLMPLDRQRPTEQPVTRGQLLAVIRDRRFMRFALVAALACSYFTLIYRFINPYLIEAKGLTLITVGLLGSVSAIGGIVFTLLLGRLGTTIGRPGALGVSVALFGLALTLVGGYSGLPILAIGLLLSGAWIAGMALMDTAIAELAEPRLLGTYYGVFSLICTLGMSVGPALGGWLYTLAPGMAFQSVGLLGLLAVGLLQTLRLRPPTTDDQA